ncbi:hypothetical protein [Flavobacterium capsici]|uniref:FUSC family protein n=1 Tax=Flavobacterium capsici TaxID=3075618 RepID=A0AA96J5D7_9FLAO|nr:MULTISPECIES: hypothetical protein [unclassified Flavobacterium]WNM20193.1 hypothetical protein RN608_05810 [Flavobacterium sp. PMR2A8]WNM21583.1 hypothetical protein RN605_12980 [Flavobacterium sp. PMTSA4]
MEQNEFSNLTDEQLLQYQKRVKQSNILTAFIIGVLIGVAIYSAVKQGIGFYTFFPLFFVYLLARNGKKQVKINKEINSRNSK